MSLFDPTSLANDNLEANATRRDPLPITPDVLAQVTELKFSEGTVKKQGPNHGKPWNRADWTLEITDPDYLRNYGDGTQEKVTTSLGIMLDLEGGRIATGANRNIRLGRFRDACGANGKPLSACVGQMIRIAIGHKPHPNDDGNPDGEYYGVVLDEVTNFTRA